MDGEIYYNVTRNYAIELGLDGLFAPWESLGAQQKIQWDQLASEKELRSQDESASVQRMKGTL